MNEKKFIIELKELIEKYKLDKITGFKSVNLALGLESVLISLYDMPIGDKK